MHLRRRKSALPRCGRGGIGRRAALRSLWGNPWKFESSRPHQRNPLRRVFSFLPICFRRLLKYHTAGCRSGYRVPVSQRWRLLAAAVRRLLTCFLAGRALVARVVVLPSAASRMPPRIPPATDVLAFVRRLVRRVCLTPVFLRISDIAPLTTPLMSWSTIFDNGAPYAAGCL